VTLSEKVESIWYGPGGGRVFLPALLGAASLVYRVGLGVRDLLYGAGVKGVKRPPVPCVSVGNLVVGGTGKTPVARWICGFYRRRGMSPGVISRGYGGERKGPEVVTAGDGAAGLYGDEPAMLALLQPEVPVVIGRDRWAAGVKAADACGAKILVADDAFQHRRLGRDLDIVVVDAERFFGNGRIFPRGPLREPVSALGRADVILLTRVSAAGGSLDERRALLAELAPAADLVEGDIVPTRWRPFGRETRGSAEPPEGGVFAFCGLANPNGFAGTLRGMGRSVDGWRAFPDHHRYSRGDIEALALAADRSGAVAAVTTAKDAVRLGGWPGRVPLFILDVELNILAGAERLEERLTAAAQGRIG
jgi:tetraacyldisaccharide 4'-kinase